MKNWTLRMPIVLAIGAVLFMITNTKLNAAQSVTMTVELTIQEIAVLQLSSFTFTAGDFGQSKVTRSAKYQNKGNVSETFTIRVGNNTGGWSLVSTQPGQDEFRISAIWHHWVMKPLVSEFDTDDILTKSDQTSSNTIFFNNNETHEKVTNPDDGKEYEVKKSGQMAVNVQRNEIRDLYLKIDFPTGVTGGSKGNADIIVSAIATPEL